MPSIVETHPDIAAQWHPTKNTIGPEEVTAGSGKKVWWLCPETCPQGCLHEWEAPIYSICGDGNGCPCCSNKKICIHTSFVTTHPEISKEWHPTKNTIKPEDVTAGSSKKVWWICPKTCPQGCKHEWEATVANRCIHDKNCPYCSIPSKKRCIHDSLITTHPDIAKQLHPTKNKTVNINDISPFSNKKLWWLCSNTCSNGCIHEWEANVSERCSGRGCPYCSIPCKKTCIHNSFTMTHPYIAKQLHPTKNNNIIMNELTAGSGVKVWWICSKQCPEGCIHEWQTTIMSRCKSKTNCPYCCNNKTCIHTSIVTTHPDITIEFNLNKNIGINKENITSGSGKKVWWLCKKNHEYKATIKSRCKQGTGCPTCKNKTAQKLFDYIKALFPDATAEFRADWCKNPYTNKHLPFDIFIPSLNVIIELDGAQHFKQVSNWDTPEYTQLKDVYKMRLANQNNIKVIRLLQEEVYEQPLEWLDENLKPELSTCEHPGVMFISDADVYDYHISLYEANTLEQCLEKLQALHDTDPEACNDSDESEEEEAEEDTDESEE